MLHTWCVQSAWDAPTIVGGHGAWLVAEGGREILDMSSLSECSTLGHQHPRVVEAIVAQALKGLESHRFDRVVHRNATSSSV